MGTLWRAGVASGGKTGGVLAQNPELFLGEDLLAWLVLAFGAALVVGNVAALLRPPAHLRDGSDAVGKSAKSTKSTKSTKSGKAGATGNAGGNGRPPVARSAAMIVVGLLAAIWGLASLVGG